jgi:hypothetical protein
MSGMVQPVLVTTGAAGLKGGDDLILASAIATIRRARVVGGWAVMRFE